MFETANRFLKFKPKGDSFRWSDVRVTDYKRRQEPGLEWVKITREVLVGKHQEKISFELRYFEIKSGGHSSLEKHAHAHVVIAQQGIGRVICGGKSFDMYPMDTIYIEPWVPHQFLAPADVSFGFFCIVDAERDPPTRLTPEENGLVRAAGAVLPPAT